MKQSAFLITTLVVATVLLVLLGVYVDVSSTVSIATLVISIILWIALFACTCFIIRRSRQLGTRMNNLRYKIISQPGDDLGDYDTLELRNTITRKEYEHSVGFY